MARVVRNSLEREFDLIFLINLARTMGDEFTGTKAHAMLNEMRANVARQQALAIGHDPHEAEEAAQASQLSVQAVRRQLRQAKEQVQQAARSGMALLLENQIADLQDELDDSYRATAQIWEDIEASRRVTQRMTKGRFRQDQHHFSAQGQEAVALVNSMGLQGTEQGQRLIQIIGETMNAPPVEPQELVTVVKETAATAALYTRLVGERADRRKLREEMRALYYGREVIGTTQGRQDLHQVVTGEQDPERAREMAVQAMTNELQMLVASEEIGVGPWTPEMIKVQRARTTDMLSRIRAVRELSAVAERNDGTSTSFAFRVVELDPDSGDEKPVEVLPPAGAT